MAKPKNTTPEKTDYTKLSQAELIAVIEEKEKAAEESAKVLETKDNEIAAIKEEASKAAEDAANSLAEKTSEVEALKEALEKTEADTAEIEELKKTIEEKDAVITELMKNIPKTSATTEGSTFALEGKEYRVVFKSFIHKGKTLTAAEVVSNPKIAKELLDKKSPAIKLVG